MHPSYHMDYATRKEIDPEKWDACIHHAANSLIYGRSDYLDHMADGQWDALIIGNYEAVMPLPWRKKWGIRYLYQPAFTQQLGLFSAGTIPATLIDACLERIRRHFRFAEIFLNYGNAHAHAQRQTNLILNVSLPYAQLAASYKKDLIKNLKPTSLQYVDDPPLIETLALFKQHYHHRLPQIKEADYSHFQSLCLTLQKKGQLILRGMRDHRQELLATALIPRDEHRLYLLQSTVTETGRQMNANHLLLDRLIHEFAEQPLIFDFEGSELPGIAHFYRNFGSEDQPYYFHRYNELSWPLRLFK